VKVALASDHAGYVLKETVKKELEKRGFEVEDFGTFSRESVDYPDLAFEASFAVQKGECECGILVCGTGIGVSITANKMKGIRAAPCTDCFSAYYARAHNDANILTLGSRVIGDGLALKIVDVFLETSFEGGRHDKRVKKIKRIEEDL